MNIHEFTYLINGITALNQKIKNGIRICDGKGGIIKDIQYKYKYRKIIITSNTNDSDIIYILPEKLFLTTFNKFLEN